MVRCVDRFCEIFWGFFLLFFCCLFFCLFSCCLLFFVVCFLLFFVVFCLLTLPILHVSVTVCFEGCR